MADFCESLIARGFTNNVEDDSSKLKSLIIVKENYEVFDYPMPDDYFAEELSTSLMTVIPTDEKPEDEETNLIRIEEEDGA